MYNTFYGNAAGKYDKLKLCYIDDIDNGVWDYTPEAKAFRKTEEWKEQNRLRDEKLHRDGFLSSEDREFGYDYNPILKRGSQCQNYPNPDYIPGKQEYYAYFTPIPLSEQWGDDWNDAPYEHNAGIPYDDIIDEVKETKEGIRVVTKKHEVEIVRVPFYIPYDGGWKIKFAKDWGGCNSPFSVEDINGGAVAWIYDTERKIGITAGCNPREFLEKIEMINVGREYIKHEYEDE